ncbi:MAG: STAS domain-containing protein [Chloroherpetonaceae bacterium]|nr:STAS domain-containing protein [Chloroherpetonaceae bacterium]
MTIKESSKNGVHIFELKGDMLGGPDAVDFKNRLKAALDSGEKKVVVDLGGVNHMNSTGIGILVSSLATVNQHQGKLKLSNLEKNIRSIFVITNLAKVFESYDTLDAALASF